MKINCYPLIMMEASSVYSFFHDQVLFLKLYANINSPA